MTYVTSFFASESMACLSFVPPLLDFQQGLLSPRSWDLPVYDFICIKRLSAISNFPASLDAVTWKFFLLSGTPRCVENASSARQFQKFQNLLRGGGVSASFCTAIKLLHNSIKRNYELPRGRGGEAFRRSSQPSTFFHFPL